MVAVLRVTEQRIRNLVPGRVCSPTPPPLLLSDSCPLRSRGVRGHWHPSGADVTTTWNYLTFICPCIANIKREYNQQDATFLNLFISVRHSACFRRDFWPSSGAQNCTYSARHLSDHYCCLLLAVQLRPSFNLFVSFLEKFFSLT